MFSYLYREYAGLRYEDTQKWQDAWAPTEMYGATAKRDATDARWMMALEMEEATAMGGELYSVLLDNLITQKKTILSRSINYGQR